MQRGLKQMDKATYERARRFDAILGVAAIILLWLAIAAHLIMSE